MYHPVCVSVAEKPWFVSLLLEAEWRVLFARGSPRVHGHFSPYYSMTNCWGMAYQYAPRRSHSTPHTGTQSRSSSRVGPPSWCSAGPPALSHTRNSRSASCASAGPLPRCTRLQRWSEEGEITERIVYQGVITQRWVTAQRPPASLLQLSAALSLFVSNAWTSFMRAGTFKSVAVKLFFHINTHLNDGVLGAP